jgi:MOSC domain-containing protein YiiM
MEELAEAPISVAAGLEGDYKGAKYPSRQITVLSREAWDGALVEIDAPHLAWTARRANLLVAGVELPRARGAQLSIGPVRLEVTGQTYPCVRMEEAHPGLLKALARDWRGGLTCRVVAGGHIAVGAVVEVLLRPPSEAVPRLPG